MYAKLDAFTGEIPAGVIPDGCRFENHGEYNELPELRARIREKEFFKQLSDYTPVLMAHRQPYRTVKGVHQYHGDLTLFYYERVCHGVLRTPSNITYWRFGCEHREGGERSVGNCLTEYTCPKCGYKWTWDSSG